MKRAAGSAALGAVLLLCAATFAMRSMYIPGITFLVLGAGFAIWVTLASAGARLERQPGPATVEEEAAWPLKIVVTTGVVPPPGGEVVEPLLKTPLRLSQMSVGRDGKRRLRVEVRFSRRGRRVIEDARLIVRDPLGLASREIEAGADVGEVLVLPRLEPVLAVEGGGAPGTQRRGRDGDDGGGGRAPAPEMELDVLRPYRPGAPATRIHWPTLARTGELMERRFVAAPPARPRGAGDSHTPGGGGERPTPVRARAPPAPHPASASSTPRCARRRRLRTTWRARAAAASCCPGTVSRPCCARTCAASPRSMHGWHCSNLPARRLSSYAVRA